MNNDCNAVDFNSPDVPWSYCPSFPAAILFSSLFFIVSVAHLVQAVLLRKKFCWVIIMGALWETLGFALRSYSTQTLDSTGPYIPAQILIVLAPLWLNAFIYMVLGRMIHFFLPDKRCFGISARRLTLIFVILDVFAFLIQGASSSMLSSDDPKLINIGKNIYMAGIGAQELFILIFFGLAIRFHYKMNYVEAIHPPLNPWRPLIYTVYAGLILITVRIIFRLCEYSQGVDTPLAKNEAALYVLDITTMFIAILFFNIFHPGWYLAGPESEFPKKEKKQNKDVQPEKRRRFWSKEKGGDAESNTELEMFHMQEPDYRP